MTLWWKWIRILQVIRNGSFSLYLICKLLNSTLLISLISLKMIRFSTTVCNLPYTLWYKHKELKMSSKFGNVWVFRYLIKKDHFLDKVAIENFTIDYHSKLYQNIQVINYSSLTHILILWQNSISFFNKSYLITKMYYKKLRLEKRYPIDQFNA